MVFYLEYIEKWCFFYVLRLLCTFFYIKFAWEKFLTGKNLQAHMTVKFRSPAFQQMTMGIAWVSGGGGEERSPRLSKLPQKIVKIVTQKSGGKINFFFYTENGLKRIGNSSKPI